MLLSGINIGIILIMIHPNLILPKKMVQDINHTPYVIIYSHVQIRMGFNQIQKYASVQVVQVHATLVCIVMLVVAKSTHNVQIRMGFNQIQTHACV
jgi:hypothetical protein